MYSGSDLGSKSCNRGAYVCQHLSFILCGKTTKGKSRSKPDPGNLAVRDCRGACRNMLHGLITICHEVGNDRYRGSYWPKTGVRYISISTHRDFPIRVVEFDAVMTGNSRPLRVICDRLLYGKQFCDIKFIGLPGRDSRQFKVNGGLTLKSGHSLLLMLCRG